jgi:hypothetical protein
MQIAARGPQARMAELVSNSADASPEPLRVIARHCGNHERYRLLRLMLRHGRVSFSIGGLSGVARGQISGTEAAMAAVGNRDGAEGVTVPGRER